MYYRETRRRRIGRGGRRGMGAVGLFLLVVVVGVAAYVYFF